MKKSKLTLFIFLAMLLGIATGYFYNQHITDSNGVIDKDAAKSFSDNITIMSDIFLRLIKMIIVPLVFSTLVVGVAKLGDIKTVGRIGGKTLLWFLFATLISLSLGMLLVNLFEPGMNMNLPLPEAGSDTGVNAGALNFKDFISHIFPKEFFIAIGHYEILPVIVISVFTGLACASMPEKSEPVVKFLDAVGHIMLKIVSYIMLLAPFAVFASLSAVIATKGIGIMQTYLALILEFYGGLLILWTILFLFGFVAVRKRIITLFRNISDAILLAFGTASSETAYPKLMTELERFGCSNKVTSFVLPLGYSFNLDGSMMYMTFGSLFIAQCYHIHLSLGEQITMLLTLMITSKGIAGVPRAAIVVISGVLTTFHIPAEGILLLMGIDQILDMGRSATNVVGNAVATVVVSKWEKQI